MPIGVFLVHGMGEQSEQDFAATVIEAMTTRLAARGVARDEVVFGRGYWADLLNDRERALLAQMARGGPLRYRALRGFIVNALGDAVAYRRGTTDDQNLYYDVHRRILERLRALRAALGDQDAPLVVLAHSLGSVIMSDFIWDAQHPASGRAQGDDAFVCMQTLAGFITVGSNLPLFTLALPKVVAIAPPRASVALSPAVRAVARWENYYDQDDVLGWPLKSIEAGAPLAPGQWSYADAVDGDHAIDAGNILTAWNPLSHMAYWKDRDFLGPAAEQIAALARAARGGGSGTVA